MLSSSCVLPNECSPNVQKVSEITYILVNSFLTEMQFLSMQLNFHRENKILKMFLQVSFKNFPEAF